MLIQFVKNEERVVKGLFVADAVRHCDICGKEITGPYFEVMTSHSECDDVLDSIRLIDCCDSACLHHAVDQYLIDIETHPSMEFQIWYKRQAISKRDLVEINEDAEQRLVTLKIENDDRDRV